MWARERERGNQLNRGEFIVFYKDMNCSYTWRYTIVPPFSSYETGYVTKTFRR